MITAKQDIMDKYGEGIKWQTQYIQPYWVLDNMDVVIEHLEPKRGVFSLGHNDDLFRRFPPPSDKRYLCGQAIMALADSLLIFPIIADIGHNREIATLDSSTQFLKPVYPGAIRIEANIIQQGRRTMRGVVDFFDERNRHCSTSMVCYMFVEKNNH